MQNPLKRVINIGTTTVRKKQIRYTGIIASSFISIQCVIWIILTSVGILCFYLKSIGTDSFSTAFKIIYLDFEAGKSSPCVITPIVFHVICWFYLIGSSVWLVVNIKLIVALCKWEDSDLIKRLVKIWAYITYIICGIDFLIFILFLVDFNVVLYHNIYPMKQDGFNLYKSASMLEPIPSLRMNPVDQESFIIEDLKEEIRRELREYIILKNKVKLKYLDVAPHEVSTEIENPFVLPFKKTKREAIDSEQIKFSGRDETIVGDEELQEPRSRWLENVERPEVPSVILMTLSIRGYIVWFVNLVMAIGLNCILP